MRRLMLTSPGPCSTTSRKFNNTKHWNGTRQIGRIIALFKPARAVLSVPGWSTSCQRKNHRSFCGPNIQMVTHWCDCREWTFLCCTLRGLGREPTHLKATYFRPIPHVLFAFLMIENCFHDYSVTWGKSANQSFFVRYIVEDGKRHVALCF